MPYRLIDPAVNPKMRTFLHIVGGVATGLLVVGTVFVIALCASLLGAIRDTQIGNTTRNEDTKVAAEQAARATERIEDCTTPGRECFDQGQRRLGRTVGQINEYALYAAACADRPYTQTVAEIQECIVNAITATRGSR